MKAGIFNGQKIQLSEISKPNLILDDDVLIKVKAAGICGSDLRIIHGKNDSLSPFTESIKLDNKLQNSNLLITELFEHREISSKISIFTKFKEIFKIGNFLSNYYKEAFSL